jgi:hypothetical protein
MGRSSASNRSFSGIASISQDFAVALGAVVVELAPEPCDRSLPCPRQGPHCGIRKLGRQGHRGGGPRLVHTATEPSGS